MNTEINDLENIRKTWRKMGTAFNAESYCTSPEALNNKRTTLDRLRRRYMSFMILSISAGIIEFPIILHLGSLGFLPDNLKWPVAISFMIMMLIEAGMDFWFWKGTGRICPLTMTVSELSSMALYYKKCHIKSIMVCAPMALGWIVFFIYAASLANFFPIFGIITGAAIGLFFGIRALKRFMAEYKSLYDKD